MSRATVTAFRLRDDALALEILDQRALPCEERWLTVADVEPVAQAIETLAVRGAPAIACVAALGMAVAAQSFPDDPTAFRRHASAALDRLARTRPTAVNLFVALGEMRAALEVEPRATASQMRELLLATARAHVDRDRRACFAIGEHGAPLLPRKATVLTHCNAGALATAGYGTALGVIRRACELGHDIRVLIDETRPVLQGARLTAWEMVRERIPAYLITDNMAASFMRMGRVDAIVVGADRIARNGDTANKIGTYGLAVLAKYHKVPFYVAAPMTTIDYSLQSGRDIVIEQRPVAEVKSIAGFAIAPDDIEALNPAFDVIPAELITKIITDRGVADPSDLERWSPEQKA